MTLKTSNLMLLAASILCLYIMPHFYSALVPVGAGFAIVLTASSRPTFTKSYLIKYAAYLAISVGTYYFLFQDPLGSFHSVPVLPCSVIMAFAGWLLIGRSDRWKYVAATLLIQAPLSVICGYGPVNSTFELLAKLLGYTDSFSSVRSLQALQFLWMLNYYLPIYLWSHRGGHERQT